MRESESFKTKIDIHRLDKVKKSNERLKRYRAKIDQRKKLRLRENLIVVKEVFDFSWKTQEKRFTWKILQKLC